WKRLDRERRSARLFHVGQGSTRLSRGHSVCELLQQPTPSQSRATPQLCRSSGPRLSEWKDQIDIRKWLLRAPTRAAAVAACPISPTSSGSFPLGCRRAGSG